MDDSAAAFISREIAKKIEDELEYPGQIKVVVIREIRAVDYAKIKAVSHTVAYLPFHYHERNSGKMKGVFSRDGETFTSSMSLIVSLLIRYPEIATLRLNPADSSLIFSFIFRHKFSAEEKQAFREELRMSLEALALLDQVKPEIIELSFKRQGALSFLEIKRDIASFSPMNFL